MQQLRWQNYNRITDPNRNGHGDRGRTEDPKACHPDGRLTPADNCFDRLQDLDLVRVAFDGFRPAPRSEKFDAAIQQEEKVKHNQARR